MDIVRHDGELIVHAEKKLLVFHIIDVVQRYDCVKPLDSGKITSEDIKLANIMGARFGKRYSGNLIGQDISFIPDNLDLMTMGNQDWDSCKQIIKGPLQNLLNLHGVGCSVLTKAIHRKRPNFIPVCDAVVVGDILGANSSKDKKSANTILLTMERLRDVGQKNSQTLGEIRNFLVATNKLPDLSNLRMLEALYWMEKTERYTRLFEFMQKNQWWV